MQGIFLTMGRRAFFLESGATRKTKNVVLKVIEGLCKYRGFCPELTARALNDKGLYKEIQYIMDFATLERVHNAAIGDYYKITGRNFGGGYDLNEIIIL